MILHENVCQQTILMKYALFDIFEKRQKILLPSPANYRWRFKG